MKSLSRARPPFSSLFTIKNLIGKGAFGEVYECENKKTKERCAVKLERTGRNVGDQLDKEIAIYRKLSGCPDVCRIHWSGSYSIYRAVVMDLLDKSVESQMSSFPKGLSLKSVLMLADQMLRRIELLHRSGYIHRDIKADNFAFGLDGRANTLFLIDYGLSKRWADANGQHIPYRQNCPTVGTMRYVSINGHLGLEQSRRDDMESLGYLFVYLLKGSLPWQGVAAATEKERCARIAEMKLQTSLETLCDGCPSEFREYLRYVRMLRFDDEPEYAEYRRMFSELFARSGFVYDNRYEWNARKRIIPAKSVAALPSVIPPLAPIEHVKCMFTTINTKKTNRIKRPSVIDLRQVASRGIKCM